MKTYYCQKCGSPIKGESVCPRCGDDIIRPAPRPAVIEPPTLAASPAPRRGFRLLDAVCIILILAVTGLAAIYLTPEAKNTRALKAFLQALVGILIYFLPSVIAHRHRNANAILALNLFLGWTFIGWVAALVWACYKGK